jgi:hypothetical protein
MNFNGFIIPLHFISFYMFRKLESRYWSIKWNAFPVKPLQIETILEQVLLQAAPACLNPHQYQANECHSRHRQYANWLFDRRQRAGGVDTTPKEQLLYGHLPGQR